MAVRACSTRLEAWLPSRTRSDYGVGRSPRLGNPYSAGPVSGLVGEMSSYRYRRLVADRCTLANGVGVLPDVFTVTVSSIQRDSVPWSRCPDAIMVNMTSDITDKWHLAPPLCESRSTGAQDTDHEPQEPAKNDGWAPPKHPAFAGLVLQPVKAVRPDGPAVGVGCRNRDKIVPGSSQPPSWTPRPEAASAVWQLPC